MPAPAWTPGGCLTFHSIRIAPAAIRFRVLDKALNRTNTSKILTWSNGRKHKVSHFQDTLRARRANPEYRLWVILVLEGSALASNYSPSFSNQLSTGRNINSWSDNINTSIKKDNFTSRKLESSYRIDISRHCIKRGTNLCKNGIQSSRVIRDTISLCTVIFHANELSDWIAFILRMHSSNDSSRAIKKASRLVRCRDITLCKYSSGTFSSIYVALPPRCDRCSPSVKDNSTTYYAYSNRHVGQF